MLLRSFDFRHNAIGFLRLAFAALVVVSHAYPLGGFGDDPVSRWSGGHEDLGNLAVAGFFVLSGFLITRSAERSRTIPRFLWHRFLRIFPAFWTCLVVTVVVLAPAAALLEGRSLAGYLAAEPDAPLRYLAVNADLTMRQYGIGGLLDRVPYPRAFDGSLWTLRFEFGCYAAIAALAALQVLRRRRSLLAALTAVLFAVYAVPVAIAGLTSARFPLDVIAQGNNRLVCELIVYFFLGGCAYAYRDRIPLTRSAGIAGLLIGIVALHSPFYGVFSTLGFTAATLWLAAELPLRDVDRRIDLSYGLYIYAFPLQQLCVLAGLARMGLAVYVAVPLLGALTMACGSWFAVERPALSLKEATPFALRWLLEPRGARS
ncbi:MAG TPA: acyltransferase [Candidatus Elarobacter sp.]|jgi:peptidoglycan/LPS O-acetylase OafA/YrhL